MYAIRSYYGVSHLTLLVPLEEEHLGDSLVGVDLRRQRGGVGDFDRDVPLEFRFERGDVDDNAAARIGGFAQADCQDVAGDLEVLDGARQGKRVRRDDARITSYNVCYTKLLRTPLSSTPR